MAQTKLENHLRRVSLVRRLVWVVLAILYLANAILLFISKTDPTSHHFSGTDETRLFIFALGMVLIFIFLLIYDLLWCRFKVFQKEGHTLTLFRGFFRRIVYVDAKERGRLSVTTVHFLDVHLTGKVRMTIVFSNAFWHLCHITYSDGTPAELI